MLVSDPQPSVACALVCRLWPPYVITPTSQCSKQVHSPMSATTHTLVLVNLVKHFCDQESQSFSTVSLSVSKCLP